MFEKFENGEKLYFAAGAGDEGRVSEVLAVDGINVNYNSPGGWSPLHVAAGNGYPQIIRLLHQAGAELESRTDAG